MSICLPYAVGTPLMCTRGSTPDTGFHGVNCIKEHKTDIITNLLSHSKENLSLFQVFPTCVQPEAF